MARATAARGLAPIGRGARPRSALRVDSGSAQGPSLMRDRGPVGDRRGVHLAHLEKADCTVSDIHESLRQQGLVRPLDGRVLGGVCAGLGRRFGLDPWPARLLFVLILMVIPGSQILIYPILWILMPSEARAYPPYGAQPYQQYGAQPYPPNAAPYGPPTPPPVG